MKFHNSGLPRGIGLRSIRRQDVACLLLHLMGFSRIRNFVFYLRKIPLMRILVFHDVRAEEATNFRSQVACLMKKANVISLDDFFDGRLSSKRINVAITFDDGYQGWIENVVPVLVEFRLSATFFVSSGFVGLKPTEEAQYVRNNLKRVGQTTGGLDSCELSNLIEEGFSIGGHTMSHSNLAEIRDINILRSEIQNDKNELERITGTRVEYFAYPFGAKRNVHIDLAKMVQDCGYRGAVTVDEGFNTASTNFYFLRREIVSASMPVSVFEARFLGNHDGVMFVRKILRL
jgi:peptidoglycan/xylan/chitin deacetylase (PgdA/CDA1 family)